METTFHGIGDTYKISEEAFWKKDEQGPEDQDVQIDDRAKETGELFYFVWKRGDSNANIEKRIEFSRHDPYSFYRARKAFSDRCGLEIPEIVEEKFRDTQTAFVGRVYKNEHSQMYDEIGIVIHTKQKEDGRIRIISAFSVDIMDEQIIPYVDRRCCYAEMIRLLEEHAYDENVLKWMSFEAAETECKKFGFVYVPLSETNLDDEESDEDENDDGLTYRII